MYSKSLYQIVKDILGFLRSPLILLSYLPNMTNSASDSDSEVGDSSSTPGPYVFRPFVYEEIKPHRKSKVPYPRSGHRIGADSANFYSFGGYNPLIGNENNEYDEFWVHSYPLFQELWKFNYARKEWARYPNSHTLPLELASNALVLHKNCLMVYGGTGSPFGFRCNNQLFVCRVNDPEGLMAEINTTGQLPLPAYGQTLVYHNDYLYTIGGTTGILYTSDIHRLNLKTFVWEVVYMCTGSGEYEPQGRYRHEVAFDGRNIYMFGGGTALFAYDFQQIPVFSLEENRWYPQQTLRDNQKGVPLPRRCHGTVQITTPTGSLQVFIAGGHDGVNIFDDLWRLDMDAFRWTCIEKCTLPKPLYFHATACSPEGRLYIFGGICSHDNDVRRSNSVYSTWLCIPKLSEMCWEAVLHYSPHITKCRSEDLVDAGLPRHFVQRLSN